jgi:hypothetical protein
MGASAKASAPDPSKQSKQAKGESMSQIISTWLKDGNPNSGVNLRPLPKGDWDGVGWDGQHHRCSNNVPFGGPPASPTAYEFIPPITWSISATKDNPANIFSTLK